MQTMGLSALQASAYLHHLHLGSPDPARLAKFYAGTMEMVIEPHGADAYLLRGPGRRLLISKGEPRKLLRAGFGVRDEDGLAGLRARADARGVATTSDVEPGLFTRGAFSVADPDGNQIAFGLAAEDPASDRRALRGPLQHLTLASRDIDALQDFYAGKLGFGVSDRVFSTAGKMMTCFMRGNHEHHNLACFYQDRAGIDHHSYEAGEWDAIRDWADHFASQDIQLMWGPGRHGPGNNLFIFIVDPDGNWIEVSAELEVIHDRPVKDWPHAERTLNLWGRGLLRAES
jgi:catechol 2,3-dioxygenase